MSETLEERLMRHEGFCSVPKLDVAPNFVVGIGHDITPGEVPDYAAGITMQDALDLLDDDIERCKDQAGKWFPWVLGLDDVRYDVIIEMIFQMGNAGVNGFPKMIAAIRDKDYNTAAKEMLNSKWHQQTSSRAEELANLMLYGGDEPT